MSAIKVFSQEDDKDHIYKCLQPRSLHKKMIKITSTHVGDKGPLMMDQYLAFYGYFKETQQQICLLRLFKKQQVKS
jgi:hypothetical protein